MKNIKYLFLFLMTVVSGLAFSACSNTDKDYEEPNFLVLNPELTFDAAGGTQTVNVQANAQPTATVIAGEDWCKVAYKDNAGGTYNFDVTVSAVESEDADSLATVRIIQGYSRKDVTVKRNKKSSATPVVPDAGMTHNAKELASLINIGINIGNTMECTDVEGSWNGGTKVNEAYIKGLKAAGFNAVRIPCAWNSHLSNQSTYEIDAAWMSRVKEVVTWCVQNDLYVVLNAHWDGGWLEDNIFDASKEADIIAEQKAIWTQIANNFNSFDEHLLFAACNEPGMNETSGGGKSWKTDASAQERVIKYEQTMIDAVRATGGNNATRVLIMPGLGVSISDIYDYQTALPTDKVADRMMVEAHFYEPYQFALMTEDASWGKMYYFWGKDNKVSGSDRNTPDNYAEAWVDAQMAKMKSKYVDNGIPVIIGEFSADLRNLSENQAEHEKSVAYYGEYVAKVAKNNGCVPFYWETGSIINRTDGTVKKQAVVDGLIKGAGEGKYPW